VTGTALVNYTSTVPVATSVSECQARLAAAGADHIGVSYDDGLPVALTFRLFGPHGVRDFAIPVDVDAVQRLIARQLASGRIRGKSLARSTLLSREHAARVAWRLIKDWTAVQCALVEASLIPLDEVMLPHLLVDGELTLAAAYRLREDTLLELQAPS
jgi:hypothetical protein